MPNQTIPQSFIDATALQLDQCMQSIKNIATVGEPLTVEQIALYLYDKRGMITDTEHRKVLVVMAAILMERATSNG